MFLMANTVAQYYILQWANEWADEMDSAIAPGWHELEFISGNEARVTHFVTGKQWIIRYDHGTITCDSLRPRVAET